MDVSVLYPSFYEKFACTGSACDYTCCKGWKILIDKKTYLKYRAFKDPELKNIANTCVKRHKTSTNPDAYAYIHLDEHNACSFLDESGLCKIQKKLGPGYLSNVCLKYPRIANAFSEDIAIITLTPSCIESLRLYLYNEEPISFIQKPGNKDSLPPDMYNFINQNVINYHLAKQHAPYRQHLFTIHNACIDIMQARRYSIAERLLILGLMLHKLDDTVRLNQVDSIPDTTQLYTAIATSDAFEGQLASYPSNPAVTNALQTLLFNFMQSHKEYRDIMVTNILGDEDTDRTVTTREAYDAALEKEQLYTAEYFDTFASEKAYVLENFFVSQILFNAFPFTLYEKGAVTVPFYQNFILLAQQYALIQLLFCVQLKPETGITPTIIEHTLAKIAHITTHSDSSHHGARQYIDANLSSPAHISFLLR